MAGRFFGHCSNYLGRMPGAAKAFEPREPAVAAANHSLEKEWHLAVNVYRLNCESHDILCVSYLESLNYVGIKKVFKWFGGV